MRASILIVCILAAAVLFGGCGSRYYVVQMPEREADLYPLSQTKTRVTIAIDQIKEAARAERYFGANLIKQGIVPVVVVVSNYSERAVNVRPSDILLHRGRQIVDPLPIDVVAAIAKERHVFLRAKTQAEIDDYFEGITFKETALPPNESYQGVMFFAMPKQPRRHESLFMISSLFREGGPKVLVGVTDLDTRERLRFGPFSLSLLPRTRSFARIECRGADIFRCGHLMQTSHASGDKTTPSTQSQGMFAYSGATWAPPL